MSNNLLSYIFAGLDFLVDTKGNFVFIEANSDPGLIMSYEELYGTCDPIEKFIEALKTLKKKKYVFIYSKEYVLHSNEYGFRYKKFEDLFGAQCSQVILSSSKLQSFKMPLRDVSGKIITDAVVSTSRLHIKKELSQDKSIYVPNPFFVSQLTLDKWKTYKIVKTLKFPFLKIPKTFIFSDKKQLLDALKKQNLKKFVIKPRFGTGGKGIIFVNSLKNIENLEIKRGKWIVQEKIEIQKQRGKFWDIRVFVVNGKYVGAVKRVSKKAVVNIALGGVAAKVEKKLQKKLAPIAEKCVAEIEQYAQKKK